FIYLYVLYLLISSFLLTFRRPPTSTLFPYTTLFRSSKSEKFIQFTFSEKSGRTYSREIVNQKERDRVWGSCLESSCNYNRCFCADRKSTRLNSSHVKISYAVFCLKKKKNNNTARALN